MVNPNIANLYFYVQTLGMNLVQLLNILRWVLNIKLTLQPSSCYDLECDKSHK